MIRTKTSAKEEQLSVRVEGDAQGCPLMCRSVSYGSETRRRASTNPSLWHTQKHKFKDASEDRRAQLARTESREPLPPVSRTPSSASSKRPGDTLASLPSPDGARQVDPRAPLLSLALSPVTRAFQAPTCPSACPSGSGAWGLTAAPTRLHHDRLFLREPACTHRLGIRCRSGQKHSTRGAEVYKTLR